MKTLLVSLLSTLAYTVRGQEDLTVTQLEGLQASLRATGGDVFLPDDDEFHSNTVSYGAACTERPKAVFLPATEDTLREALLAIVGAKAEFVVSTSRMNQGCLSTTTGYLINMRRFHTLEFDKAALTARLGAGLLGDEVNQYMQSEGDYYVDGLICTWGGVIGPIFGGGFSWHFNYAVPGTMADNALSFRFMDYKGDVYTVSADENPDLYWGLRGGGGQLGIVTEVTMRVFQRSQPFTVSTWTVSDLDDADQKIEILDRTGYMNNDLPDSMGVLSLLQGNALTHYIICDWCDPAALMAQYFPEAQLEPASAQFEGRKQLHEVYGYLRSVTVGFLGRPERDPNVGFTFDEVMEAYPVMPLTLSSWFFSEHTEQIMPVFRDVLDEEIAPGTTVMWTVSLGNKAFASEIDSAESTHKDAKMVWSLASLAGDENIHRIFYNGMAGVKTGLGSYWNYNNKFTSEEFTFTTNLPRIRAIRKKYDPEGVFKLPERKYQGSKLLEVCYDRYHCSGHGKLRLNSRNGIPENGKCQCSCEEGWTGVRCQTKVDKCGGNNNNNNNSRRGGGRRRRNSGGNRNAAQKN